MRNLELEGAAGGQLLSIMRRAATRWKGDADAGREPVNARRRGAGGNVTTTGTRHDMLSEADRPWYPASSCKPMPAARNWLWGLSMSDAARLDELFTRWQRTQEDPVELCRDCPHLQD